jgi:hypothetical protein
MDAPARVVHPLIVIALVLAAVCGYLLGSHRVATTGAGQAAGPSRVATAAGLLLEYPVDWERSSATKSIPGLTLDEPVTLSPGGSKESGLLMGMLPAGEAAPLPASFLAQLGAAPHAEVVSLVSTQAYRYSDLKLPGYEGVFDLYAIPAAPSGMRMMACFAPKRQTAAGQQCETIAANSQALVPTITGLDTARATARRELAQSSSAASVVGPARALAARFEQASGKISALEAPAVAATAQVALSQALVAAGKVYGELAGAAEAEAVGDYDSARGRVTSAEDGVDKALENLVLLGYGPP